jgi:hypothetical protein
MNKVRWLLLVLMVMPFMAGCEPIVEIRVMTDRDLTATALVTDAVTRTAESPTTLSDTPEATATPSETEIPATEEASATPTPLPTDTPLPSPTARRLPTPTRPRPTATPGPQSGATRIRFQTGAISATVSGQLGPQGSRLYVLRASAGQLMEVTVVSSSSGLSFAIWGEDGTVLKQHAENRAECVLPSSQDYFVALYSGGQAASYHLTVMIGPREGSALTRIRFAPGATSAVLEGRLESGACAYYVLGALAGQRMEVQVTPGEVVGLEVLGQDGSLWGSGPAGILVIEQLLQTGDYYLTLCTPSWADATRYTLEVTIPPR